MRGAQGWLGALLLAAGLSLALSFISPPSQASNISYVYDPTGRLVSATYDGDATCQSYAYDAAGNRTKNASTTAGPPVANPASATTPENTAVTFSPLTNDSSPSCYPLTISSTTTPAHGTATLVNGATSIKYTPTNAFYGTDAFNYTISDGHGGNASSTVTVAVSEVLVVTIGAGQSGSGSSSHTFSSNTVSVSGGSGSYSYSWTETDNGAGIWTPTSGTGTSVTPAVSGIHVGGAAQATYTCTVTDTVTHVVATSNGANYEWDRIS